LADDPNATRKPRWPVSANGDRPSLGEIGLNQFGPYLINRIATRWNSNIAEDLKAFDMSTTNMRVLCVLSVMPTLTINELAVYGVTEQSTMSRTLDTMEDQGWVKRQPRSDDMRIRDVSITDEGRAALALIWPGLYDRFEQLFDGITDDEYRHFVATLHRMLHNIRKHEL
jgi:DNA-binding MarR family transcriptional regulator